VATEAGAQSRLNDIIDSVVRDQVSSSELVELVRSASWEVPEEEVLEEVTAEQEEEIKKQITRGREEITRTILAEARKIIPNMGSSWWTCGSNVSTTWRASGRRCMPG
jgi:modulator of FtsH protease HflC